MNRIDPAVVHSARTTEDLVVLLRQVRAVSELSFWQLQERAAAGGLVLEPAVLAQALGPAPVTALPDPALVAALLYACGYPGDEIDEWLDVHDRLAAAPAAVPAVPGAHRAAGDPGVFGASRSLGRTLAAAGAAAAVLAAVVTTTVVIMSGGRQPHGGRLAGNPPQARAQPGTHALPYATTGTAPAATVSATPPRHTSPAAKTPAGPAAAAGVARSGSVTLTDGQGLDLDTGATAGTGIDLIAYGDGSGVRAGPAERHFAAHPAPTKPACATAGYQKTLGDLRAGATACVRTDRGAYGQITVTGTGPLVFSYVVWS